LLLFNSYTYILLSHIQLFSHLVTSVFNKYSIIHRTQLSSIENGDEPVITQAKRVHENCRITVLKRLKTCAWSIGLNFDLETE